MNEHMKTALAGLRTHASEQRYIYTLHLAAKAVHGRLAFVTPTPRVSYADRASLREPRRQLSFTVPLYRALLALSQQPAALASTEKNRYLKLFETLLYQLRLAVSHGVTPAVEYTYRRAVPLLLAERDVAPSEWKVILLKDLLEYEVQALASQRLEMAKRGQAAEDARKSFIASLTPDQVQVLRLALAAAKAKGTHAVMIDERDLTP